MRLATPLTAAKVPKIEEADGHGCKVGSVEVIVQLQGKNEDIGRVDLVNFGGLGAGPKLYMPETPSSI